MIDALIKGLEDTDSETQINVIWALGSLQAEPAVAGLEQLYKSRDAGIRKMVVYALGAIPAGGDSSLLETALADVANDVRWNAAVALARHGRDEGVSVIREMVDEDISLRDRHTPLLRFTYPLPTCYSLYCCS